MHLKCTFLVRVKIIFFVISGRCDFVRGVCHFSGISVSAVSAPEVHLGAPYMHLLGGGTGGGDGGGAAGGGGRTPIGGGTGLVTILLVVRFCLWEGRSPCWAATNQLDRDSTREHPGPNGSGLYFHRRHCK